MGSSLILTDELGDRLAALNADTLRRTGEAACAVMADGAGAEIGGGFALFAGSGSPLTQALGFGHRTVADPAELEAFFRPRTEGWEVSVTPFTHRETVAALVAAGYRYSHTEAELGQVIERLPEEPEAEIWEVGDGDPLWMETTGRGWTENEDSEFEIDELLRILARISARKFLAFVDGQPAATASLMEFGDSVVLAGAATRVPFRGRGLQSDLLTHRLRIAGAGRFAMMGAMPGSTSYRNAQRAGFEMLYPKTILLR